MMVLYVEKLFNIMYLVYVMKKNANDVLFA